MLPPKKALVHHTGVLGFPLLVLVSCFATHPILCQALLSFGPSILLIWYSCRHFECKHKDATDAQNAQRLSFLLWHLVTYRVCEIKGNNFRSPWPIRSVSFWMAYWPRGQDLDSLSAVLSLTQLQRLQPSSLSHYHTFTPCCCRLWQRPNGQQLDMLHLTGSRLSGKRLGEAVPVISGQYCRSPHVPSPDALVPYSALLQASSNIDLRVVSISASITTKWQANSFKSQVSGCKQSWITWL